MKRMMLLAGLLAITTAGFTGDQKPKKFELTFTITYNTMTLEEAAKKESVIRGLFKDACKVDVSVRETPNVILIGRSIGQIDSVGIDFLRRAYPSIIAR